MLYIGDLHNLSLGFVGMMHRQVNSIAILSDVSILLCCKEFREGEGGRVIDSTSMIYYCLKQVLSHRFFFYTPTQNQKKTIFWCYRFTAETVRFSYTFLESLSFPLGWAEFLNSIVCFIAAHEGIFTFCNRPHWSNARLLLLAVSSANSWRKTQAHER